MQQNIISLENVPQQSSCSDIQCVKLSSFFPAFIPRSHTDFLLLFFHYLGRANQVTQSSAPTLQSLISSNQCINNLWSYYFFFCCFYTVSIIYNKIAPMLLDFILKNKPHGTLQCLCFRFRREKKRKQNKSAVKGECQRVESVLSAGFLFGCRCSSFAADELKFSAHVHACPFRFALFFFLFFLTVSEFGDMLMRNQGKVTSSCCKPCAVGECFQNNLGDLTRPNPIFFIVDSSSAVFQEWRRCEWLKNLEGKRQQFILSSKNVKSYSEMLVLLSQVKLVFYKNIHNHWDFYTFGDFTSTNIECWRWRKIYEQHLIEFFTFVVILFTQVQPNFLPKTHQSSIKPELQRNG